jgi:hypothetical protein
LNEKFIKKQKIHVITEIINSLLEKHSKQLESNFFSSQEYSTCAITPQSSPILAFAIGKSSDDSMNTSAVARGSDASVDPSAIATADVEGMLVSRDEFTDGTA